MSIWNRLFGKQQPPPSEPEDHSPTTPAQTPQQPMLPPTLRPVMRKDDFPTPVVGTSYHQRALEVICARQQDYGQATWTHDARLIPEEDHPYDQTAVRVEIEGQKVGHLSRANAVLYREKHGKSAIQCNAIIAGGWDNGEGDRGNYGVLLDLIL